MPIEDKMTVDERRKYVGRMKLRYNMANRRERGRLLQEMEQVTAMHHKSLIRLVNADDLSRKARTKHRGRKYGAEADDAIRVISESLDYICAERLTPILPEMAGHLEPVTLSRVVSTLGHSRSEQAAMGCHFARRSWLYLSPR